MELIEVTQRHRNDFHWRGKCRHCDHVEHYRDGYADEFYCLKVVPRRHCPECGKDCYGYTSEQREAERAQLAAIAKSA